MLVLTRQMRESVIIGGDTEVTIVDIRGDKVRLGISAPPKCAIHRKELYEPMKLEEGGTGAGGPQPGRMPPGVRSAPHAEARAMAGGPGEPGRGTLYARAPGRIDFGGGGTDVAPYCVEHHGIVVNAAIDYYAYATLEPRDDRQIHLHAIDLGKREAIAGIDEIRLEGDLDLIKACIRRAAPSGGFSLSTYSEIPLGSGLSSSAAIAVVVCAICTQYEHGRFDQAQMAQMAAAAERDDLNHWTGKQDQFAAAMGGWSFLEFVGDEAPREPAPLSEPTLRQLEKNLLLVFTGKAHLSGDIHLDILADYKNRTGTVLPGMHGLKEVGRRMREALKAGDLNAFAALLNENWKYHQMLHPTCATPELQHFIDAGLQSGALGAKVCGAGGGGCVVYLADDNQKPRLAAALRRIGGQIMPFAFDTAGTIVW
jgi:D-glycero-alpha-D-manno-heptose-7-phosphate kinase